MTEPGHVGLPGVDSAVLVVCDHASADLPRWADLGVPASVLATHVAVDLGAGPLARRLARRLGAEAILGRFSRLVVDLNRPEGTPGWIPEVSDGVVIPGNRNLSAEARALRRALYDSFHAAIAERIARTPPRLLVSVHSFTPQLATDPAPRPWPVAVLWNRDDRAATRALAALRADPAVPGPVGANEPYSGRVLNHTMDRHAEANGIPYVGFEVRQDGLETRDAIERWAGVLERAVRAVLTRLSEPCVSAG
ncbi:MAG: N-formylglutamate amidohydrolase [Sphingomonadaceae bacterium]|uniref:N-formylglutamate amidohydrolase n=1 Tax=Thermaurantiacus sp. TaxID=2820283 RepID=UPI00298F311E|nr:N-formylglutamate amidohydrolase [Thermaurantiacus sp.]MCS6986138.1 N-formylglutamate amidohydrolase [Sphingomonadaceae bacterium]MDW8414636.1 N-formylglutamate amidohydrolase [Thermaurantiacus sp.]